MRSVGSNFVDAAFRPNSTLLLFGTETESKRRNIGRWLRPSEIRGVRAATISEARLERYVFVKRGSQHTHIHTHTHTHSTMPWTVFRGTVDPDDICQGKLGDCWFLSALSCLAQRPDLVRRLVLTQTYNPNGCYLVRLVKNGLWKNVIVDDYFPCTTLTHKRMLVHLGLLDSLDRYNIWCACFHKFQTQTNIRTVDRKSLCEASR